MAYCACKFAYKRVLEYIEKYEDFSYFKEWIPGLSTPHLADIWYRFPERYIHDQSRHRHMIASIERYLDDSLELHLKLWEFWYDHDREEILEVVDSDALIEVLEVIDDVPFKRVLSGLAQFPANEKVITILEHFTHDDEVWVVNLSRELLKSHTNS